MAAYDDEKRCDALSKTELDVIVSQCPPYDEALRKSGHLIAQASLEPARPRPRKGKVSITDGPFAETTEQVGAVFIIGARDRAEAVTPEVHADEGTTGIAGHEDSSTYYRGNAI